MSAPDILIYKEVLIILAVAGIIVPVMHHLRINSIIGFLFAGAMLGPHGFGALTNTYPSLENLTISNTEGLTFLGDLGIVFLLFLIG